MLNAPLSLDRLWGRGVPCPYDAVIDVRSPGEYAEDHIPGAINLPVLNDAERAEVGTVYHRDGPFAARKIGAAYVSANIGRNIHNCFTEMDASYRPLLYCWRGGQRSASFATVLAHVGWRVTVLRGGYRTYRRHVLGELDALPPQFTFRIVGGPTGTAKTRLLQALARRGGQILDLERLANHRGSILGRSGPQPTQKQFESDLLARLDRLDPLTPVWVESESHRIGDLHLPPALWKQMRAAKGVIIEMPVAARVQHLLLNYSHFLDNTNELKSILQRLASRRGSRQIEAWHAMIDARAWEALVASLLATHYDPSYRESSRRCYPHIARGVRLPDATDGAIEELADRLVSDANG